MNIIRTSVAAGGAVLLASTALAQPDGVPRTAVSFVGGAGSSTSTTGIALGGSWLFDLNDRVSVEAQGMYLDRGAGTDAMSANGSLLVNLLPARERIVPYAAVGGGMYRASFDLANPAFLGPVGMQFGPGSIICPARGSGVGHGRHAEYGPSMGTCPATAAGYWDASHMPNFYAQRLGPMTVPMGGAWESRSFMDPAISVGGGLRFNVSEHLMVRPDIRALVVFAEHDTHTLGVFAVQLGYRF